MGAYSLNVIKKVMDILLLAQDILKDYQTHNLTVDDDLPERLPTTKKVFEQSQSIIKKYQSEPNALPLGVFSEIEKITAELLKNPNLEEKIIRLVAILQKYPPAKEFLSIDIKNVLQNFLANKQKPIATNTKITSEPYLKRILECKKDLFDTLKGNKQLVNATYLTAQMQKAFAATHPLSQALKVSILDAMNLLFSDGDVSNDTMHAVAGLIIKNGLELFDTPAELEAHFAEHNDFYTQNAHLQVNISTVLPLLSGYILQSTAHAAYTPTKNLAQPSAEEKADMEKKLNIIQLYLKENPRFRA